MKSEEQRKARSVYAVGEIMKDSGSRRSRMIRHRLERAAKRGERARAVPREIDGQIEAVENPLECSCSRSTECWWERPPPEEDDWYEYLEHRATGPLMARLVEAANVTLFGAAGLSS